MRPFPMLKLTVLSILGTALAFVALGYLASPAQAIFDDSDGDGVIDLAETIAGSSPSDPLAVPEDTGVEFIFGAALCRDGRDNDADGLTDNQDPGCRDSDGDVVSDPMETLLGSNPANGTSFPEDSRLDTVLDYYGISIFACADGTDNDLDGRTDAADPGCTPLGSDGDGFDDATEKRYGSNPSDPNSVPEHERINPGSCSDGLDNDGDGMTDAADPACAVPANDNRANATAIPSLPYSIGPSVMKNATVEAGEPRASCMFGGGGGSIWYRYTAGANATLVSDTRGSNFATTVAAFRDDGGQLAELACAGAYPAGGRAIFDVESGKTYYIQVSGFASAQTLPQLAFHLAVGHPPANDGFLNASSIASLPFSDSADLTSARSEYGEPAPTCGSVTGAATVWYRYQTNADTLVVLNTSGSNFPAFVGVWTETIFGLGPITCGSSQDIGQGARAAFRAQPGRVYYVQVGRFVYDNPGFNGYDLSFSAIATPPLPNDDFAGAQAVTSLPFHGQEEALTLSLQPGEPTPGCAYYNAPISSAWYKYTPGSDVLLRADSEGGYYNSYIAIYTGASISTLTEVGCSAGSYPFAQTAVEAHAGETYYIQVGQTGFFGGEGFANENGRPTGFPFPPGDVTRVFLNLSSMPVPSCSAPQFTVQDPVGDVIRVIFGGPPGSSTLPDITSVSGGSSAQDFCMTVQFAGPIDPPNANTERSLSGIVEFDTDANRQTGIFPDSDYLCPQPAGIRMEAAVSLYSDTGVLVPVNQFNGGPATEYAIARYGAQSLTLIVPLSAIGGDTTFDVAVVFGARSPGSDCAPNGGAIHSPTGAITLPWPPGDVNCNNSAGPIDATLILQYNAGLVPALECAQVGDVNHDGRLDTIDASLLLQLWAQLIPSLPEF